MVGRLRAVVDRLVDLSTIIAGAALVFVATVILVDVVGRYFGSPLAGARDFAQMAMVIVVFGGMPLCERLGGHIAVDIFQGAFSSGLNRLIDLGVASLGAVLFALVAWRVIESSLISLQLNLATNIVHLPKAYFQWGLAGFAALTAVSMALRVVEARVPRETAAERSRKAL